jgi:hypothetical protein
LKREEIIAKNYLLSTGFNNIIYEPDGNIPPDFLVNSSIAIEVRRLNQFITKNGKDSPIEDQRYELLPRITKLLNKYTLSEGHSAYVSVVYSRPIRNYKSIEAKLTEVFDKHIDSIDQTKEYTIDNQLKIRIRPAKRLFGDKAYVYGSISDHDSGGCVIGEIVKSLKKIIPEKERKIERVYSNYKEWWLLLVDATNLGFSAEDFDQLKTVHISSDLFAKILILSSFSHLDGYEIFNRKTIG